MPTKTFFRLRDEKQEAIMRSAIHEFTKNGFSRAKTEDIAENAGISKASIFKYFENKKELFIYCAKWGLDVFMKKMNERVHLGDMDVFDYFRDNSAQLAVLREEHEIVAFMQVAMNEKELLDDSMKGMYEIGNIYTKKLIQNGIVRGTVRNDIDAEILMEYFYAVTDRFGKRWANQLLSVTEKHPAEPSEESVMAMQNELDQVIELLKNGMGC